MNLLLASVCATAYHSPSGLPTAGHKVGKYLAFNCLEVSAHCTCVGPRTAWGKPSAAIAARYQCAKTCPLCSKVSSKSIAANKNKPTVKSIENESGIYETDCRPMIAFCGCKNGISFRHKDKDHCRQSCRVCEYASVNFREIHVKKTAKDLDSHGVAMVDIRSMLQAIAQREAALCKQGTEFGEWSDCTRKCGGGMRYRYRDSVLCVKVPQHSKPAVLKKSYEQHQRCSMGACTGTNTKGGLPSLERPP